MAFCLGHLRWTPQALWRATPREVAAALGRTNEGAPSRERLATMLRRYPD